MARNYQPKNKTAAIEKVLSKAESYIDYYTDKLNRGELNIHFSYSRDGKIKDIISCSIFPSMECWKRYNAPKINNSDNITNMVCEVCYGCTGICTYRINMIKTLVGNMVLFNSPVNTDIIPCDIIGPLRINAFGNIHNIQHTKWIVAIARKNKKSTISVIDKRPGMFKPLSKIPHNMIITGSHYIIDDISDIPNCHKVYCVVNTITDDMRNNIDMFICEDKCMKCYINDEGCYSRKGPRYIIRKLQK